MKISVIVPSFNSANHIERTLKSVWNQTYRDFEVIVMDGGSTDGTKNILERNSNQIAYWQSTKDAGTTDAMNAGFRKSSGDVVTFLCSDDQLSDERVLERVVDELNRHPEADILCGALKVVDPAGMVDTYTSMSRPELLHSHMTVHLPGSFFRREVLRDRQFDQSSEVANDYELFAYLTCVKKAHLKVSDQVAVTFSLGGRTNDVTTDFWKARECYQIRRKYYGFRAAWTRFIWDIFVSALRKAHFRPLVWARKIRWHLRH